MAGHGEDAHAVRAEHQRVAVRDGLRDGDAGGTDGEQARERTLRPGAPFDERLLGLQRDDLRFREHRHAACVIRMVVTASGPRWRRESSARMAFASLSFPASTSAISVPETGMTPTLTIPSLTMR